MSYTLDYKDYIGVWEVDAAPEFVIPRKPLTIASRLWLNRVAVEQGWEVRSRLGDNSDSVDWQVFRVTSAGLESAVAAEDTIPWATSAATTTITSPTLSNVSEHYLKLTYNWGDTSFVEKKTITIFDSTGANSSTHGAGNVVSLHSFSRPGVTHVVWQTENGDLVARTGPS